MKPISILVISVISFALFGCKPVTPSDMSSGYKGIQEVDTIISALLQQDVDTIVSHVQFIQLPCTHQRGLGGPPKCDEGQEEGTVVEVFPILGAEGFYLTPESVHGLKPNVGELYAVYEVPKNTRPIDIDWPVGQYGLVFPNNDPVPAVITVFVAGGKIVRLDNNFVESPEQALPESAQDTLFTRHWANQRIHRKLAITAADRFH